MAGISRRELAARSHDDVIGDSPPTSAAAVEQPSLLARAKAVFTAAIDLSLESRQEFLHSTCGDDVALLELVRRLLAAVDAPLPFENVLDDTRATDLGAEMPTLREATAAVESFAEVRIGNYRLIERIGEGGFGMVFLAEQERPLRRQVAIKIIKLGMDTREVIARFEGERQALAIMEHPNVARVFDAGTTASGRPYFVMELVKGVPITTYCDTHRLAIPERLQLFAQVCDAIQHAHQRGIIHRDIKPSNLLVTEIGGRPVPKVIDFGIAKATSGRLAERTTVTQPRHMIGTPEYMSPEQAGHPSLDIDTRTDVYSAGAVLYELLTGSTPFESTRLRSAAYGELQRIIRDEDPPRPSTRITTRSESIEAIADERATHAARLAGLLRGELDWIVMKAMEKDRSRRYDSADALAADIRRHLSGQAVLAAPPGAGYRARKFVRRHRGPVIAGTLLALALVGGLLGTSVGLVQAGRQGAIAAAERQRVETINEFVMKALRSSDPFAAGRGDTTIAEAMESAIVEIERGAFVDDPETAAALKSTIGQILENNGHYETAEALLRDALAMRQELFGGEGEDHPAIAESLAQLAHVWVAQGRLAAAEPLYEQALAMQERLSEGDDPKLATTLNYVANERFELGRPADAAPLYERSLAMRRRLFAGDHADVAESINDLARVRNAMGSTLEAESLYSEALAMYQRVFRSDHPRVAVAMNNLAVTRLNLGRAAESEQLLGQMTEMCERLFDGDHEMKALALHNMGRVWRAQGRLHDAERSFDEALRMQRRLRTGDHTALASALSGIARCRQELGKLDAAERDALEAVAMFGRLFPEGHPRRALAISTLALVLEEQGRRAEAIELVRDAEAMVLRAEPPTGQNAAQVIEDARRIAGER